MSEQNSLSADPFQKLADTVYLATKYYFNASKRLAMHNSLSQWSISILSLGLIAIPLFTISKLVVRFSQNTVDCASIIFAVAVLAFSLLLNANNYAVNAEKMRQAGLALNELMREMRLTASSPDRLAHYPEYNRRYGDVLRHYPNDDDIDWIRAEISVRRTDTIPFRLRCRYFFLFSREIAIYCLAVALEIGFIVAMLK